jgi:hypothetical protein
MTDDGDRERRWYPINDPVEWEHTTRKSVFASVTRCIGRAVTCAVEDGNTDRAYSELHTCVGVYARGLYALGQNEAGVAALFRAAAKQVAASSDLYPAMVVLLEKWCRDSQLGGECGSDTRGTLDDERSES